jgi:hypothetical protein
MPTLTQVTRAVEAAFASVPHPGSAEHIWNVPCCPDHDGLAAWFAGHSWQEFLAVLRDDDPDPTSFAGILPQAFVYFLPAVLLHVANHIGPQPTWKGRDWRPVDWLYFALIPFDRGDIGARWTEAMERDYLPLFTRSQRGAVAMVLDYVACVERLTDDDENGLRTDAVVRADVRSGIELWNSERAQYARGADASDGV